MQHHDSSKGKATAQEQGKNTAMTTYVKGERAARKRSGDKRQVEGI